MTYQEFVKKYLGQSKGYPTDTLYRGECLSIVKLYILECFGISPPPSGTNSAYGYWSKFPSPLGTKFEKVLNTDDLIPEAGWIAVWKPWDKNQYGHISIVAKGSTKSVLKNWAQNWTSGTFQLESNNYGNVVGFLKPKVTISEPLPVEQTMTDEQKRILDFIGTRTEGDVREAFGYLADKAKYDEQMATLSQKVLELDGITKSLQEKIDVLSSEVTASNEIILKWQSEASSAKDQASKAIAQINSANEEKNKYRRLYEGLLDVTIEKTSTKDLLTVIINRLFKK